MEKLSRVQNGKGKAELGLAWLRKSRELPRHVMYWNSTMMYWKCTEWFSRGNVKKCGVRFRNS